MQLVPLARAVKRQRRRLAACAVAGGLLALALDWHAGPTFAATSQLFVAAAPATNAAATRTTVDAAYLAQRVQTYAGLATSQDVLSAVAADIPMPGSGDLAQRITATAQPGTVLLHIRVVDASPARARTLADAVARHLAEVVQTLETPSGTTVSTVKLMAMTPLLSSPEPLGPQRGRDAGAGLLGGLALGVAWAAVRAMADSTIRTRAQLEPFGAPLLAEISEDALAGRLPLIVTDPFSSRAEAYRRLRTNLRGRSAAGSRPVRSIVVTSPLPGEGRTTTACNLAIALAQNGEEVVLVDADLRRGAVADMFGLSAGIGLTNVLAGERPLSQALHVWRQDLPLRILPTGPLPPNPSEVAGSAQLVALVTSLTAGGLSVVLDSPPLLPVTDAALLATATDGAVIVVQSGATTTADLRAGLESLGSAGARVLGIALNRSRARALSLPPAAASPRRRRSPTVRSTSVADVGTPGGRLAPPDTIAGSVSDWPPADHLVEPAPSPQPATTLPRAPMPKLPPMPRPVTLPPPVPSPVAASMPAPVSTASASRASTPMPPSATAGVGTVPRQAAWRDGAATLAAPPAPPPGPPREAPPVADPAAPPMSRREARRRLIAVPDVEGLPSRPHPVDLREQRLARAADPSGQPGRASTAANASSVWAPPASGYRGA